MGKLNILLGNLEGIELKEEVQEPIPNYIDYISQLLEILFDIPFLHYIKEQYNYPWIPLEWRNNFNPLHDTMAHHQHTT